MLGLRVREGLVWALYCVMVAIVVPRHEAWGDEAQAWLLARDLSIPQLMFHNLRYESHPALWYLILWVPAHLHWSYGCVGWISAAIGAAGVYVLLRWAPFPFYVRALLPFTYFLAYQYAVIARSYVLFPLLCFGIAHVYRDDPARPVRMAVLLSLLANVSVHGTLVAVVFAILYGSRLMRRGREAVSNRSMAIASLIFAASLGLVWAAIRPAADVLTVTTPTVAHVLHMHTPPDDSAAGFSQAIVPQTGAGGWSWQRGRLITRVEEFPRVLWYGVSSWRLVALAFYALTVVYLAWRRRLSFLLPIVVLALFLGFIYAREWHLGLVWIVLLMLLWAVWDEQEEAPVLTVQNAMSWMLAVVAILQIGWTWQAVAHDLRAQYSPAKATAAYLRALPPDARIAGFSDPTAILPYFPANIFFNQPSTFKLNSTHDTTLADAPKTIASHPDVILDLAVDRPRIQLAEANGYGETHRFCGTMYLPDEELKESCYVILEPLSGPTSIQRD